MTNFYSCARRRSSNSLSGFVQICKKKLKDWFRDPALKVTTGSCNLSLEIFDISVCGGREALEGQLH